MERHISLNTRKQKDRMAARPSMDGMGKPLVDIPIRQTNEGGSAGVRLESVIAAISGLKLEQLGTGGRGCGKENLDIQDGGNEFLGK